MKDLNQTVRDNLIKRLMEFYQEQHEPYDPAAAISLNIVEVIVALEQFGQL